jgi:flagellar basal-body rod modification protein FlgD
MDNTEFVSQMAQFSSLEQLQNMNASIEAMLKSQLGFSALNLIGRTVLALNPTGDEPIKGKVESITFEDGLPILKIGKNEVPVSYVINVSE